MLSEEQYQSLAGGHWPTSPGMTALQWLLMQPSTGAPRKSPRANYGLANVGLLMCPAN